MTRRKVADKEPEGLPAVGEANEGEETGEVERVVQASPDGESGMGEAGLSAGEEDSGMRAIEPVLEGGEVQAMMKSGEGSEVDSDGGMRAFEPILEDGDLMPTPGLPVAEMALPQEASTRGAPLFSADFLEPGLLTGQTDGGLKQSAQEELRTQLFFYQLLLGVLALALLVSLLKRRRSSARRIIK